MSMNKEYTMDLDSVGPGLDSADLALGSVDLALGSVDLALDWGLLGDLLLEHYWPQD